MATLEQILERRKEVSGQVSSQTRASALGLLAISWAFLTAHDEPLKGMVSRLNHVPILFMGAFAAFSLMCDLLQYVWYTKVADAAIVRAESSDDKIAAYDNTTWYYKGAALMYKAKYSLLVASSLILASTVTFMLIG